MEEMEAAWQNCETLRDGYVKNIYDTTRGGQKLSKGNLYCPVFKDHFHALFFLDLPVEAVLAGIDVPPVRAEARESDGGVAGSTSTFQADGERVQKRQRQEGSAP
jgi:hypothetical protein